MPTKSLKNTLLLAKVQTVLGTDPVPTAAANSILVRAYTPKPLSAEFVERNNIRGFKGNFGKLAVGVHREWDFEVEMASAGAAGTAPKFGPLIKASGFAETISAGTSVVYNLVSSGEPYITLYGYLDGLLFKMIDSKLSFSLELSSKAIPVLKFKAIGEYSAVTDVAFPTTQDFTGWQMPRTVGKVNTPTFSLHGIAPGMQNLTIDLANALQYRDLVQSGGAASPDRSPGGSVSFEMPSVASLDIAERVRLGTTGAMQLIHGVGAGNIVQIDAPAVQFTAEPDINDDNTVAMVNTSFSLNPVTGNDELVLTFK